MSHPQGPTKTENNFLAPWQPVRLGTQDAIIKGRGGKDHTHLRMDGSLINLTWGSAVS